MTVDNGWLVFETKPEIISDVPVLLIVKFDVTFITRYKTNLQSDERRETVKRDFARIQRIKEMSNVIINSMRKN